MADCSCVLKVVVGDPICSIRAYRHVFSSHRRPFYGISPYRKWQVTLPTAVSSAYSQLTFMPIHGSKGLYRRSNCMGFGLRGRLKSCQQSLRKRFRTYAELDIANAVDVINDLGFDTLTFLMVTVMVVPAFKLLKASPILGFFCAGVILNQFGFIRNLTDVKVLSEWGILFLKTAAFRDGVRTFTSAS